MINPKSTECPFCAAHYDKRFDDKKSMLTLEKIYVKGLWNKKTYAKMVCNSKVLWWCSSFAIYVLNKEKWIMVRFQKLNNSGGFGVGKSKGPRSLR